MSENASGSAGKASPESDPLDGLRTHQRKAVEDLLRALLECEYRSQSASEAQLADYVGVSSGEVANTLRVAAERELVAKGTAAWRLTSAGHPEAVRIMRAHRLIETRLARESSVPARRWHDVAHSSEHDLTDEEVNRLADALDNPRFDPHGDPIPTRNGGLPKPEGVALLGWGEADQGVISHIEDEPPKLFAKLAILGVAAGDRVRLLASTPAGVRLLIEAKEVLLPVELAGLVRVRKLAASEVPVPDGAQRLSEIGTDGVARVLRLLPGCAGRERSRLLDLGFVPGSRIERMLQSPFGGPAAFRVRGTMIALRRDQADQVLVMPETTEN